VENQIANIKDKLEQLRKLDKKYVIFGSPKHRYQLNPKISKQQIENFEIKYGIELPDGYAKFLMHLGNGGAGPFYGVETLEGSLFDDLDYKDPDTILNLSKPFPHSTAWNLNFDSVFDVNENEAEYYLELEKFEEVYFATSLMDGSLAVCNLGCGINVHLIVNGNEYGNMWTDNRSGDYGIHPFDELGNKERIGFLDWYELWLDNSLEKINTELSVQNASSNQPKPWWKIW